MIQYYLPEKNGLLLGYLLAFSMNPFFEYFGIEPKIFMILSVLFLLDSFLGGWKSDRLKDVYPDRYSGWAWKKFYTGLSIKMLMAMIPFLFAALAQVLDYNAHFMTDSIMKIMCVSEFYSVFGNIYAIKNQKDVKRIDAISFILLSIRKGLNRWLKDQKEDKCP